MANKEDAFRKYVEEYDIEVPEENVENEYNFIRTDMKHRMQYGQMSGEGFHIFPDMELDEQEDELRALAYYEAKSELVLKELMKNPEFDVTSDELIAHAEEIAKQDGTPMEMIKRFFGEDLKGLERGVKEKKIKDWVYQLNQG